MAKPIKRTHKRPAQGPDGLLTVAQILAWADAHHAAKRKWPTPRSGLIDQSRCELTWKQVDHALKGPLHGLPAGFSLRTLLHRHRVVEAEVTVETVHLCLDRMRREKAARRVRGATLSIDQILAWADAHYAAAGKWPCNRSGAVRDAPGEHWVSLDVALRDGRRGLPGGSSLVDLLDEHRLGNGRVLTIQRVLAWADAHHLATGQWPTRTSLRITPLPFSVTWLAIDRALKEGRDGLPAGLSLASVLYTNRGARMPVREGRTSSRASNGRRQTTARAEPKPELSIVQILAWADDHYTAKGQWPSRASGVVRDAPDTSWSAIDTALYIGIRGLPGGSSIARLLDEHRSEHRGQWRRRLTREQILAWAEAHRTATGRWPTANSGPIAAAPGENWCRINAALRAGSRGLPPGLTLARLLGRQIAPARPSLTVEQIFAWAEAHRAATGQWPTRESGTILGAPGENWRNINTALRHGQRGLPSGLSLAKLFARRPAHDAMDQSGER